MPSAVPVPQEEAHLRVRALTRETAALRQELKKEQERHQNVLQQSQAREAEGRSVMADLSEFRFTARFSLLVWKDPFNRIVTEVVCGD